MTRMLTCSEIDFENKELHYNNYSLVSSTINQNNTCAVVTLTCGTSSPGWDQSLIKVKVQYQHQTY